MGSFPMWHSCRSRIRASLAARFALTLSGFLPLSVLLPFAVLGVSLAATACAVHTHSEGALYAEEVDAPVNIETYPQTMYEGRAVYYYRDHWYFRNGPRWTYYREEPPVLRQHRTRVVVNRPEEHREPRREERHEEPRHEERRGEHHDDRHEDHREEGHH